jgi:hypothetical protein
MTHKAQFAEEMQRSPQKLRYADVSIPTAADLEARGGPRWARDRQPDEEDP